MRHSLGDRRWNNGQLFLGRSDGTERVLKIGMVNHRALNLLPMLFLAAPLLLLHPQPGGAEDRILLGEVLPVLQGTELGDLELGAAPPPGGQRWVRRSEIVGALRAAGRSPQGLAIPASVRVRRGVRVLDAAKLEELGHAALEEALSPCRIESVRWPRSVRTSMGLLRVHAEGTRPDRSGSVNAQLVLSAGGRSTRVPLRTEVDCPPPAIQPGSRVSIEVFIHNVRATAPGEARQSGRVGDSIRVTNLLSRRTTVAEIVDAETVRLAR